MTKHKVWHVNNIASVGPTLAAELLKQGWETRFIDLPKPLAGTAGWFKILGAPVRWRFARGLLKDARAHGVDLLHVHYSTSAPWFLRGGIPLVIHAHGSDVRVAWWDLARHLINLFVCRRASAVLYATPDIKGCVGRYVGRSTFSPNPIDTGVFTPQAMERDPNLIFLNAALDPIKGAEAALDAISRLRVRFPQLRFQTMALGRYQERARELGVEILPKVPRERLPEILGKAGLILGQFEVGAVGMSELEVLAMGRTVVCHFEYGHVYPEPPPFVQARTAIEIERAVERYVNDPAAYLDLEAKARAWVERFHRADHVASQIGEVYQSILLNAKP